MIKTMMITMIVMMTTIKVVECDDYDYDHGGSNKKVDDDDFVMSDLGMILPCEHQCLYWFALGYIQYFLFFSPPNALSCSFAF